MTAPGNLDAWLDRQRLLDAIQACRGTPAQAVAALDRYRIVRDAAGAGDEAGVVERRQ
jgi:hypothetical protein